MKIHAWVPSRCRFPTVQPIRRARATDATGGRARDPRPRPRSSGCSRCSSEAVGVVLHTDVVGGWRSQAARRAGVRDGRRPTSRGTRPSDRLTPIACIASWASVTSASVRQRRHVQEQRLHLAARARAQVHPVRVSPVVNPVVKNSPPPWSPLIVRQSFAPPPRHSDQLRRPGELREGLHGVRQRLSWMLWPVTSAAGGRRGASNSLSGRRVARAPEAASSAAPSSASRTQRVLHPHQCRRQDAVARPPEVRVGASTVIACVGCVDCHSAPRSREPRSCPQPRLAPTAPSARATTCSRASGRIGEDCERGVSPPQTTSTRGTATSTSRS